MPDPEEIIRRYVLQNAILHDGKADARAVLGKIIAEDPSLRARVKEVQAIISETVVAVNALSPSEQSAELEGLAPDMLKRETVPRSTELPPLPNAGTAVVMRLAPYPSGPLHIGNARMVILNDEYVKRYKGRLLLVYDDTIGSEEKRIDERAYELIREGLDWLGVDVHGTFYKSDRMPIYYEWARKLIGHGSAYVCECSAERLREYRAREVECEHRTEPPGSGLEKWEAMLGGEYRDGEATLRIRTDMKHPNPAFRDRVLFRISSRPHPRTGTKYLVWPLLEFSWAVDDHLLGITHVLRGKDLVIEDEMENHIWSLLDVKPVEFVHYGMLRLQEMKLSKSRMRKDIEEGNIGGYEDPRTWTLQSLRKRGIGPQAVRNFILGFGLSQTDIEVPAENLYSENRKLVDQGANRYFFVPSPARLMLDRIPKPVVEVPLHPDHRARGTRTFRIGHEVFVPREDLELLRGKEVRLKDFCNLVLDEMARVTSLENKDIPRIQWVSERLPVKVAMPDGSVVEGYGERALEGLHLGELVQFERFGFARLDSKDDLRFCFAHK